MDYDTPFREPWDVVWIAFELRQAKLQIQSFGIQHITLELIWILVATERLQSEAKVSDRPTVNCPH